MATIFLLILLLISIFLERTVIAVPLSIAIILCLGIISKEKVFTIAFIAGTILGILGLQPLGSEAIFFLLFSSLVILYQHKYEINSYPFVIVSSFIGAYLYLLFFATTSIYLASLCSVFAVTLFSVLRIGKLKTSNNYL